MSKGLKFDGIGGNMVKVLVVDDEESICETLTWMLEKDGHEVISVMDFQEAVEKIRVNDYDLYIIDIFLPGKYGLDLVKLIKKLERDGIVIIMTGYPNVPTLVDAIRLEAYDYLKKPINHEHLKNIINHILQLQDRLFGNEIEDPYVTIAD